MMTTLTAQYSSYKDVGSVSCRICDEGPLHPACILICDPCRYYAVRPVPQPKKVVAQSDGARDNKTPTKRNCPECGELFAADSHNRIYCTKLCQRRAAWARRQAKEAKYANAL